MCQCWVARDGLLVGFLGVFVPLAGRMQIALKQIRVGIVGALFQNVGNTLFDPDGMELPVRRIKNAGFLQSEPGGTRVEPRLCQCLLIGFLGLLV